MTLSLITALACSVVAGFAGDNKKPVNLSMSVYQEDSTNWTVISAEVPPVAYRTNVYHMRGVVTKVTHVDVHVNGGVKSLEANRETEVIYKTVTRVEPVSIYPK